jgi:hypothetical protein
VVDSEKRGAVNDSVTEQEDHDEFAIYLFVNPKSGSQHGKKLLDHQFKQINFSLKDLDLPKKQSHGKMAIIDITDSQMKSMGYKQLRKEIKNVKTTKTRVIMAIACGDGTILSLLDEADTKERILINEI